MKQSNDNGQTCAVKKLPASKPNRYRQISKKEQLVTLLTKPNGAQISTLCKSLGWQKHTVRAAISGLRASCFSVETYASSKGGLMVYKITGKPATKVAS